MSGSKSYTCKNFFYQFLSSIIDTFSPYELSIFAAPSELSWTFQLHLNTVFPWHFSFCRWPYLKKFKFCHSLFHFWWKIEQSSVVLPNLGYCFTTWPCFKLLNHVPTCLMSSFVFMVCYVHLCSLNKNCNLQSTARFIVGLNNTWRDSILLLDDNKITVRGLRIKGQIMIFFLPLSYVLQCVIYIRSQ